MSFGLFLLNLQIIAIVMQMKRINRLKIVLAEQGKTGKWLAHALGKMNRQSLVGVQTKFNLR